MGTEAAMTPRRQQLVEAAVVVVARSGLRGLTHRAVDAQAGLPEGSCSAYLRTRMALLTALVEHVARTLGEDVAALAGRLEECTGPDDAAVATAALFVRWLAHPEMVRVRSELMLEGLRQPEVLAAFRPWRDDLVEVVRRLNVAHGHTGAERRAQTVVAALEGVLTGALLQPPAAREAYLRDTVGMVMAALAAHELDA